MKDAEGFAFAGIWKRQAGVVGDTETNATVYSIMTASPNSFAAQYHTPMPFILLILPPQSYDTWLNGPPDAAYSLLGGISQLIGEGEGMPEQPAASLGSMRYWRCLARGTICGTKLAPDRSS
ncbi:hypothetical protein So717_40660 [Roseobacter cerasinus]|uniref:Abasic site processing protein n=1 Tax=Roseobacter cerasinus TaxID=2602289 RepID=A0A640VVZ0_9RHOB|nr:hypothetical protein So717_40660 [Roseobacter cerasinus]